MGVSVAVALRMLVTNSHEAECMGTTQGGEWVEAARERQRAMGILPEGPTFIGTDNLSNALVASDQGRAALPT